MEEILLKLRRLTQQVKDSGVQTITDLKPTIETIKTNFDGWKVPWTPARASKLDNLDATTSSRASQTSVDALTTRGMVKSVQRGVYTATYPESGSLGEITAGITISAVNTAKSIVLINQQPWGDYLFGVRRVTLSSNTNINMVIFCANTTYRSGFGVVRTDWQVIEFY